MSREPEILKSIIDDTEYNKTPQSRNEEILLSILNNTEYTKTPQSREEELLLELKDKIGHGITVEPLSVTENGTYTAPTGKAYSPVEVTITPPQLVKRVTGNPIEFTDGADAPLVKCTTTIQGNQDLHGYSKPWVGGAGKNKVQVIATTQTINGATFNVNWDGTISVVNNVNATTTIYITNAPTLPEGSYILTGCPGGGGNSTYKLDIPNASYAVDAGSGVSFTSDGSSGYGVRLVVYEGHGDGLVFKPMIRLSTVQDATFEPYSNICPITTYNQSTISVGSRNILNPDIIQSGYSLGSTTGLPITDASRTATTSPIDVSGNTTVYLNYMSSVAQTRVIYSKFSNGTLVSRTAGFTVGSIDVSDADELYLCWYSNNGTIEISNLSVMQLENGSTGTSYVPYKPITKHTATFSQSIYQGNADFVGGSVTARHVKITLDGSEGSSNWRKSNSKDGSFYYIGLTDRKAGSVFTCNLAPYVGFDGYAYGTCSSQTNNVYVHFWFLDTDKTLTDWMTWLSNNPIEIEYELNTPTTETITPTNLPIKSLFGYNHIKSSTGDMVIDYITDQYQNFVDTVNRAVPNTRKSGSSAMDIFLSLEQYEEPEDDEKSVDDPTEELTEDKKENSK